MAVAARFYVASVEKHAYASGQKPNGVVKLRASTRGDQNKAWAAATPSGDITMFVGNPVAFEWFEEQLVAGRDIALTFEVAPEV